MNITDIFKATNFYERYREICVSFSNLDYTNSKPKKDEVLILLEKIGYNSKYIHKDRVYMYKFEAGIYTFEYCFEFDGVCCCTYLNIKKSLSDWQFRNGLSGLLLQSNLYPKKTQNEIVGYFLLTPNLKLLESALICLKPILDDIRNSIIPYLVTDDIEFDIV